MTMNSIAPLIQTEMGVVHLNQMKPNIYMPQTLKITMRDRSKNRKPLQRGRNLSIEAIQTVQALKRAAKHSQNLTLERVFNTNFRRLLKFDMIAVLRELLRQNQCLLALKVFEDVRKEEWYRPQLRMYAEMITVLGSNGLIEKVEYLLMKLGEESLVNSDIEGFNALLQSLMNLNLSGMALECFYLLKSLSFDPDRLSYKILMDGLESNGEMNLSAALLEDAKKCGYSMIFSEEEEEEETLIM